MKTLAATFAIFSTSAISATHARSSALFVVFGLAVVLLLLCGSATMKAAADVPTPYRESVNGPANHVRRACDRLCCLRQVGAAHTLSFILASEITPCEFRPAEARLRCFRASGNRIILDPNAYEGRIASVLVEIMRLPFGRAHEKTATQMSVTTARVGGSNVVELEAIRHAITIGHSPAKFKGATCGF